MSLGNGHRKRNPNPRWSKFRSLFKWALRKRGLWWWSRIFQSPMTPIIKVLKKDLWGHEKRRVMIIKDFKVWWSSRIEKSLFKWAVWQDLLFKWAVWKETCDDHRGFSSSIPLTISSLILSETGCITPKMWKSREHETVQWKSGDFEWIAAVWAHSPAHRSLLQKNPIK